MAGQNCPSPNRRLVGRVFWVPRMGARGERPPCATGGEGGGVTSTVSWPIVREGRSGSLRGCRNACGSGLRGRGCVGASFETLAPGGASRRSTSGGRSPSWARGRGDGRINWLMNSSAFFMSIARSRLSARASAPTCAFLSSRALGPDGFTCGGASGLGRSTGEVDCRGGDCAPGAGFKIPRPRIVTLAGPLRGFRGRSGGRSPDGGFAARGTDPGRFAGRGAARLGAASLGATAPGVAAALEPDGASGGDAWTAVRTTVDVLGA